MSPGKRKQGKSCPALGTVTITEWLRVAGTSGGHLVQAPAQAGPPRAGLTGSLWVSLGMETPRPLWAACTTDWCFPMLRGNLLGLSLCPLPFILSLGTPGTSLALSPHPGYQDPFAARAPCRPTLPGIHKDPKLLFCPAALHLHPPSRADAKGSCKFGFGEGFLQGFLPRSRGAAARLCRAASGRWGAAALRRQAGMLLPKSARRREG